MEHTIEIKKIISGGMGLGRLADGMVVMVPLVLPGERVRIREKKRLSGHLEAELLTVERPSPHRRDPNCPAFGKCGGCTLQHGEYGLQLDIKRDILAESLKRAGLHPLEEIPPTLLSPGQSAYRSTARFHLDKQGYPGFHRRGSNRVFPLDHCPLLVPPLNRALAGLARGGLPAREAAACDQLSLHCSPRDQTTVLTLHARTALDLDPSTVSALQQRTGVRSIIVRHKRRETVYGEPVLLCQAFEACDREYTLCWESRCFFQVNPEQNHNLVQLVCSRAGDAQGRRVLDLYCGMGNFTVPLALAGAEVTGVEINRYALRAARRNLQAHALEPGRFLPVDVRDYLQRLPERGENFDLVLLDPPRRGVGRPLRNLIACGAKKILYISCDPATLARDLVLLEKTGYRTLSVQPLDMFPHTHHIESLAVLEKN